MSSWFEIVCLEICSTHHLCSMFCKSSRTEAKNKRVSKFTVVGVAKIQSVYEILVA